MDAARLSDRDGPAQRLAIDGQNDAPSWWRVWGWRLEEAGEGLFQGQGIEGLAEDAAPRTRMGHGGTWQAKEAGELGGTQFGPVSHGFDATIAGELGHHGEGQHDWEGVAETAALTLIGNGLEVGGEGLEAKGKGQVVR
jgi:hypothetical protein